MQYAKCLLHSRLKDHRFILIIILVTNVVLVPHFKKRFFIHVIISLYATRQKSSDFISVYSVTRITAADYINNFNVRYAASS